MKNHKKASNPLRRCVACREMKEKSFLIRVTKQTDAFFLDRTGKMDGRGAYVCKTEACIKKAIKTKGFDRSFRRKIPHNIYEELQETLIISAFSKENLH